MLLRLWKNTELAGMLAEFFAPCGIAGTERSTTETLRSNSPTIIKIRKGLRTDRERQRFTTVDWTTHVEKFCGETVCGEFGMSVRKAMLQN
jgi:hypothetical protein